MEIKSPVIGHIISELREYCELGRKMRIAKVKEHTMLAAQHWEEKQFKPFLQEAINVVSLIHSFAEVELLIKGTITKNTPERLANITYYLIRRAVRK